MTASKVAWVTAFAGVLVALGIAVSASGMIPSLAPHSGPSPPAAGGAGNNSSTPPATYSLTFSETGLPNGTFWGVTLHTSYWGRFAPIGSTAPYPGLGWNGSTTSSIGFVVPNGTYSFRIGVGPVNGTPYSATPENGTVIVNGTNAGVAVSFAPVTFYSVSFVETGLPSGTFWWVLVGGAGVGGWTPTPHPAPSATPAGFGWNGTNGTSVGFQLPDGTYSFFVPAAWTANGTYLASPRSGEFTVNGSAVSVAVSFSVPVAYSITFTESGLPNGTNWSVLLWGGNCWGFGVNTSANSSIGFAQADGSYRYLVPDVWTSAGLYQATPGRGSVTVNGTSVSVSVSFSLLSLYNVTFVETGLPNGTLWSAALFGHGPGHSSWASSNTSSITFSRPNGTYRFGIAPAWNSTGFFTADPSYGNVTVNGTSVTIDVTFTFSNYSAGWQPSAAVPSAPPATVPGTAAGRSN